MNHQTEFFRLKVSMDILHRLNCFVTRERTGRAGREKEEGVLDGEKEALTHTSPFCCDLTLKAFVCRHAVSVVWTPSQSWSSEPTWAGSIQAPQGYQ